MKKLFVRTANPIEADTRPAGPDVLQECGILAPWFLEYRLAQEVERAELYDHALAVIAAIPLVLPRETLSEEVRLSAAAAAAQYARTTDLVGWLEQRIIFVMPETSPGEAMLALTRLKNEMWMGGRTFGGKKWRLQALTMDECSDITRLREALNSRVARPLAA